MAVFMDCTSLNVSYDIMGIATVSFTMVHDTEQFEVLSTINAGGQVFTGYVVSAKLNKIQGTVGWYETHVTVISTTD